MHLVLSFASVGSVSGLAGGSLLARLRRGTVVHSGWLAGAAALGWALPAWRVASGQLPAWWLPVPLTLTWFATLLAAVDLRHRRLPDALTLPAYPAVAAATVLAATWGGGWSVPLRAAVGALLFFGVHAAVHLASPASLGAGDVKLSGSLGAALAAAGWPAMVVATALAALLTLTLGLATRRWRDGIPHGPGLLAATYLMTLYPTEAVLTP
jgi:leader peptidase (prepilin peptidase)/N-methyltransferase